MHRIFSMCLDAAIAAVVLVPLFLYMNQHYFHDIKRTAGYVVFAIYLSGMFAVVGLPDIRYVRFNLHFNFVPFAYMFSDYENSLLNVLLFVPLGFFLPVFWMRFKNLGATVLFGFCISLLIEILQIFTLRASDVNDLMTNTFGSFIGWCIGRIFLQLVPAVSPGKRIKEVYVVCGAAFAVMFFIQPFLADLVCTFLL